MTELTTIDHATDFPSAVQKYATTVSETSQSYGTALTYYARAHNSKKVKDVLDLLISFCLVHSAAYPPAEQLDPHLRTFLSSPRESMAMLAADDEQAARILAAQMSGYGAVRKFYDVRDGNEDDGGEGFGGGVGGVGGGGSRGGGGRGSMLERKRKAAQALMVVVASAADNIQGGLLDRENPAVVPVDGLLVLLGEAGVFVDRESCPFFSAVYCS